MVGVRFKAAGPKTLTDRQEAEMEHLWCETAMHIDDIALRFGTEVKFVWNLADRRGWYRRVTKNVGAASVFKQEDLLTKSLDRERRVRSEDNPRGETKHYPVPPGGYRMFRLKPPT